MIAQLRVVERAQGADDQHVRIKVEDAVKRPGQHLRGQQAVVHRAGVVAQRRRPVKPALVDGDGMQRRAEAGAQRVKAVPVLLCKAIPGQIDMKCLAGVVHQQREERHAQRRQVIAVERKQNIQSGHPPECSSLFRHAHAAVLRPLYRQACRSVKKKCAAFSETAKDVL